MYLSQVTSYENAGDDDEEIFMMDSPAMRNLMALAGVQKNKKRLTTLKRNPNEASTKNTKMKKAQFTLATTTPLVTIVMESFFKDQMAQGVSEDTNTEGTKAEDTEDEDGDVKEDKKTKQKTKTNKKLSQLKRNGRPSIVWNGDSVGTKGKKTFYSSVSVDDDTYEIGDYGLVYCEEADGANLFIRRIEYLFEEKGIVK